MPEDTISNTLISKYLERNYNNTVITGLLDKPDIQAEITMRSFGVKNFIYLQEPNIIEHLKLFIKSFLLLKNCFSEYLIFSIRIILLIKLQSVFLYFSFLHPHFPKFQMVI